MRLINKLPLLGLGCNPSIRPTLLLLLLPPTLTLARNASRLSGIHDGLRRSERARPQGSSPREIRRAPEDEPYMTPSERLRARALARQNPITYKIRKGKKDITEPAGPPRKSRAARLSDPRDPLGSGSLLKKFRTGTLVKELREEGGLGGDGNLQHDDFSRQLLAREVEQLMDSRKTPGRRERVRPWETERQEARPARHSHPEDRSSVYLGNDEWDTERPRGRQDFGRDRRSVQTSRDEPSFGQRRREFEKARDERRDFGRPNRGESDRFRTHQEDDYTASEMPEKKKKKYEPPMSLPYTTAASQFLYGTSTVEAALEASRRKLYKLYIYQGGNRRNQAKDEYLSELAWKRGVKVDYVGEDGLALMNKMSGTRPHNGYVLEASPLPQLPIRALGEVSAEESWPGFRVSVGHQSLEEVSINGTSEFIITEPGAHKPLVLYVDQVLDPGNLGAIIRTASFMGVTAVAVSRRGSAPVTPVVLKASAGAAENLTMFMVDSPVDFVNESKENGWKIYAAVPPKPGSERKQVDTRTVEKTDPLLKDPCVLVMGSEGEGLSRQLRRAADFEVSIANMSGSKVVDSLNVSVATGLLCSAFVRGKSQALDSGVEDAGALF
ncbi:hypothetical protein M406DRAFT_267954 [Cryphonectria parasitica EP155]|uniref:rRNA methyltransferase 1, mitochondrial n=1 Tax=Cryphonectria parasitica (strain ATCC 38755 / EP155) TaxID=660469 RepID=A0A9P4XUG3_CRYP1|nr:uncharacterized protein M406DRAFT_267954 [Cryphonectria parasitica EP155]KAF3761131.1 hypothetical protein M406DRAFT_267954 [Cryphonectria parasitica EP155]